MYLYFYRTFKFIFIATIALLLVRSFIIEPGRVNGRSMEPLYYDAEFFFINKFELLFTPPERGQVVQFRDPHAEKLVIKRVIGLPGETIEVKSNAVYIIHENGLEEMLDEPYLGKNVITKSPTGAARKYGPIPKNHYLLFGDNREYSFDSRNYGPIHRRYITGSLILFYK